MRNLETDIYDFVLSCCCFSLRCCLKRNVYVNNQLKNNQSVIIAVALTCFNVLGQVIVGDYFGGEKMTVSLTSTLFFRGGIPATNNLFNFFLKIYTKW